MEWKRYTAEEIIGQLWTIEIELGKGLGVVATCRRLGITEKTYYCRKNEYGGLCVDQAKRLKGLEPTSRGSAPLQSGLEFRRAIFVRSYDGSQVTA